jgi:formiminotetrahydrofolate cyclodeaminase
LVGIEAGTAPPTHPFDIRELVGVLSARSETAASGSAAAVVGAIAAAVAAKAARFADDPGLLAQAEQLAARLTELAADDVEAYSAALKELDAPRQVDSPARDFALGQVLEQAAAVPVTIAERAADVALLAAQLARSGDLRLRPDAVAAAMIASGAAAAAAHLVEINLVATPGDQLVTRARAAAAAAAEAAASVENGDA